MVKIWYLSFFLLSIFIVGCTGVASNTDDGAMEMKDSAWKDITLTNVQDNSQFTISQYEGQPVLIETFAVWCPTCLRQQKEIQRMQGLDTHDTVHVSIEIDPNSNNNKVKEFVDEHGFDWAYAVAPEEFTELLISEFGVGVTNAPLSPVILVCANGDTHFLQTGVKLAEELRDAIGEMCS